jgi:hypothetical protein
MNSMPKFTGNSRYSGLRCTIEIPLTEEVGRARPARYSQGDA